MSEMKDGVYKFLDLYEQMGPSSRYMNLINLMADAKREAYEDAAKLAESLFPHLKGKTPNTPEVIAKAIRARAKEVINDKSE
jgi:hypothetical protein